MCSDVPRQPYGIERVLRNRPHAQAGPQRGTTRPLAFMYAATQGRFRICATVVMVPPLARLCPPCATRHGQTVYVKSCQISQLFFVWLSRTSE